MAICTACGVIHHDEDEHICDPADIPELGKPIKFAKAVVVK